MQRPSLGEGTTPARYAPFETALYAPAKTAFRELNICLVEVASRVKTGTINTPPTRGQTSTTTVSPPRPQAICKTLHELSRPMSVYRPFIAQHPPDTPTVLLEAEACTELPLIACPQAGIPPRQLPSLVVVAQTVRSMTVAEITIVMSWRTT